MKKLLWIPGVLLALALGFGLLQYAASERVEVVLLHTQKEQGEQVTTRLWVVDHEGNPWLRGDSGSGWVARLQASDTISLTRNGSTMPYSYRIRNENLATIHQLMREKYTWGDQLVSLMSGDGTGSNAIELILE